MGGVPQPFVSVISGSLGTVGPVTVGGSLGAVGPVTVAGIPDTFHINIDKLPKIQIGVDPVSMHLDPVDFNVSIKEIPSIRAHLPVDFNVGLSLLGMELMCVRLCGEAQVITEPYRPNFCERCGTLPQLQPASGTLGTVNTVDATRAFTVGEEDAGG
jgi:hypothetical protein